jgi:hypothetical protein
MKLCLFGFQEDHGIAVGKHNLRDPRLDAADELVAAKKKTYVQVETLPESGLAEADGLLVAQEHKHDLILRDLELVETRLSRRPSNAEQSALEQLKAALESEQFVRQAAPTLAGQEALAAHAFVTAKPITLAAPADLQDVNGLLRRAYREAGYISYLTVGGKENRAWKIRRGATAWEAAGVIHSDIQRGFIRAEIISYTDLIQAGGETQAKRAGKQRLQTRDYVMEDYDVVSFRFNK